MVLISFLSIMLARDDSSFDLTVCIFSHSADFQQPTSITGPSLENGLFRLPMKPGKILILGSRTLSADL